MASFGDGGAVHDDLEPFGGGHHPARTPRAEFITYFALIFLAAVPFVTLMWLWTLLTTQRLPADGPLARAWREAGIVTPMLFRP